MNTTAHLTDAHADRLARRVAAQLDHGLSELPHDISERLRAARARAVAVNAIRLRARRAQLESQEQKPRERVPMFGW